MDDNSILETSMKDFVWNGSQDSSIILAAAVAVRGRNSRSRGTQQSAPFLHPRTSTPIRGMSPIAFASHGDGPRESTGNDNGPTSATPSAVPAKKKQRRKRSPSMDADATSCADVSATTDMAETTWGGESILSCLSENGTKRKTKQRKWTREQTTSLLKEQRDWFIRMVNSRFSSSEAAQFVLKCYDDLKALVLSFAAKPPDVCAAIERIAVHNTRMYEMLTERGVSESSTSLAEFVLTVLQKYLGSSLHLREGDRGWQVARRVLVLVCTVPCSIDILLSLKSSILQMQYEFLRVWSVPSVSRDIEWVTYACSQLDNLTSSIHSRVTSRTTASIFQLTSF